jgi:inorganic phosphate transporter, PiT family
LGQVTRCGGMFAAMAPASPAAFAVLIFCFILVLAFEFWNGFHDTANAVATVTYTHSLKPVPAVVLSGAMNFPGGWCWAGWR